MCQQAPARSQQQSFGFFIKLVAIHFTRRRLSALFGRYSSGDTKVDVVEEAGKRTTKLTGVFTGTELSLLVENPYFDERMPAREDKPELNFSQKRTLIRTDDEWQEVWRCSAIHSKLRNPSGASLLKWVTQGSAGG